MSTLTADHAQELAQVLSFRDSAGNPHLDVTCPDIQGEWKSELGLAYGFPCSCCDDFLAGLEGKATGKWAKLAGDFPSAPLPQGGSGSGHSSSSNGPSEKQLAFLKKLMAEKQPELLAKLESGLLVTTKKSASDWIEKLLAMKAPAPEAGAAPSTQVVRFRKMSGPMGQGQEEWTVHGAAGSLTEGQPVLVTKADGTTTEVIPTKVWTDTGAGTSYATFTKAPSSSKAGAAQPKVPAGRYATASATGHNDLDFWKVTCPTEGKWAGYTFVDRIIGGHEDTPVRGATAKAALAAIQAAGVEASGLLYAQESSNCRLCGRHLTVETSRHQGYGPECVKKV